jgi:hypothetical protein
MIIFINIHQNCLEEAEPEARVKNKNNWRKRQNKRQCYLFKEEGENLDQVLLKEEVIL